MRGLGLKPRQEDERGCRMRDAESSRVESVGYSGNEDERGNDASGEGRGEGSITRIRDLNPSERGVVRGDE